MQNNKNRLSEITESLFALICYDSAPSVASPTGTSSSVGGTGTSIVSSRTIEAISSSEISDSTTITSFFLGYFFFSLNLLSKTFGAKKDWNGRMLNSIALFGFGITFPGTLNSSASMVSNIP